jgi:hypothetical protein
MTVSGAIFTGTRAGGGYLRLCLNSHPAMLWDDATGWAKQMYGSTRVLEPLLRCLLMRPYPVSGTKLVTGQAMAIPVQFWQELPMARVLLLERENVLRQAMSGIMKLWRRQDIRWPAEMDPEMYLRHIRNREIAAGRLRERCEALEAAGVKVMYLTFAEIAGEGPSAPGIPERLAGEICRFLGVEYKPLTTEQARTHALPLRDMIVNYNEVEAALRDAGYDRWLEDERVWE